VSIRTGQLKSPYSIKARFDVSLDGTQSDVKTSMPRIVETARSCVTTSWGKVGRRGDDIVIPQLSETTPLALMGVDARVGDGSRGSRCARAGTWMLSSMGGS
jgi:hypothetical protein